jgi:Rhamnan synthesis protein F
MDRTLAMRTSMIQKAFGRVFRRNERLVASSGLFDELWYVDNNPDAAHYPGGPLRHFMRRGARELRDPNPFFSTAWYCEQCPDIDGERSNALVHYILKGSAKGVPPSFEFDPAWYLEFYPDVALAGLEPLSHFIHRGRAEGRRPKESGDFDAVDHAELLRLKTPTPQETMALFATYAPEGRIKPHVRPFLEALASEGVATRLIVTADQIRAVDATDLVDLVDGLYVRQSEGYDFGAWAHVARNVDLAQTSSLCLINDSVIGPLNAGRFSSAFNRIRASTAQLIGLTDSVEIAHHLQSYFLIAKAEGVAALADFLAGVKAYRNKDDVIFHYEIPLSRQFRNLGLKIEALFPSTTRGNQTIAHWRELIERGCPFVKVAALRSSGEDWQSVLQAEGYDPKIAEQTIAMSKPVGTGGNQGSGC